MKLLILTSSLDGTAAHHLPFLRKCEAIDEIAVVFNEGQVKDPGRLRKRKLEKLKKIGLRGALNGRKMRKWYGEDVMDHTRIQRLDTQCASARIRFYRVPMINGKECREAFKDFAPDLAVSLGNGYIGSKVFTIPRLGMLNIHHEILPEYQNAQSVIWQLYNGSMGTGYTIHRIDKRIDTGEIVHQEKLPILFKDSLRETVSATVASLYDASAQGLVAVLDDLENKLERAVPQTEGTAYTTPSWKQMKQIRKQWNRLRKMDTDSSG